VRGGLWEERSPQGDQLILLGSAAPPAASTQPPNQPWKRVKCSKVARDASESQADGQVGIQVPSQRKDGPPSRG
jgi:hypothetical protein